MCPSAYSFPSFLFNLRVLALSVSASFAAYLSVCLSLSLSFFLCVSVSLGLSLSGCLSVCLYLSLSLSFYLSLSYFLYLNHSWLIYLFLHPHFLFLSCSLSLSYASLPLFTTLTQIFTFNSPLLPIT